MGYHWQCKNFQKVGPLYFTTSTYCGNLRFQHGLKNMCREQSSLAGICKIVANQILNFNPREKTVSPLSGERASCPTKMGLSNFSKYEFVVNGRIFVTSGNIKPSRKRLKKKRI